MSLAQAGKALHSKRAEIRVQFRHVPGNLYRNKMGADLDSATNELARSCSFLLSMHRCCPPAGPSPLRLRFRTRKQLRCSAAAGDSRLP